jgi:L-aminopeptidase/D-esterase-like protein
LSRRVSLPGASELFGGASRSVAADGSTTSGAAAAAAASDVTPRSRSGRHARAEDRRSSGRVKRDTKITVYVTEEELLGLEQARLSLRAEHGVAADRGRIVREAIDVVLADFVQRGGDSVLVQRLKAR